MVDKKTITDAEKKKPIATAKKAGKTNNTKKSLVKCKVDLETGEWVSPEKSKTFYIDENANFPEIIYEIKTDNAGPYTWTWQITWKAMACPQKKNKKRFTPKNGAKTFYEKGSCTSDSKKWKANLNNQMLGGLLTVTVKTGNSRFVRKTTILGKNPSEGLVNAELDTYANKNDAALVKKIFKQESNYNQFYSDEMPLVSFDKGYGLGQLTNPAPTYEKVWNWKKHVEAVMDIINTLHRKRAKNYLDTHGNYTDEMLDLETLAAYNGLAKNQRYHNWDAPSKKWIVNSNVICDPDQSNKGWLITEEENEDQTLEELQDNPESKPFYTGRCYAEHIKNNQ